MAGNLNSRLIKQRTYSFLIHTSIMNESKISVTLVDLLLVTAVSVFFTCHGHSSTSLQEATRHLKRRMSPACESQHRLAAICCNSNYDKSDFNYSSCQTEKKSGEEKKDDEEKRTSCACLMDSRRRGEQKKIYEGEAPSTKRFVEIAFVWYIPCRESFRFIFNELKC